MNSNRFITLLEGINSKDDLVLEVLNKIDNNILKS